MIRLFIPIVLLILTVGALSAQVPNNITFDGPLSSQDNLEKMMCNEAGTITFGTHIGQSNDVDLDTIYLCLGDTLPIFHNGDFDLSGDPQPATQPGIGYAFYDCEPTVDGMDLAAIVNDPCINQTDPIILMGLPIPQTNGIWVAGQNPNGDLTLINNGVLQEAYNGGVAAPIQFWFAPITIDDFNTFGFESSGGGPAGPCVDVNTDVAFSVVYLNAVEASNLDINAGPNGCTGSFVVEGGLPEFDVTEKYDVSITLSTDPSVEGVFTTAPGHGDMVEFVVPTPGVYDITIEDGKSCGTSFQMDMSGCQAVTFSFPMVTGMPGENICLELSVADFMDVASVQFTINWDPSVLQFTGSQNFNPGVPDLNSGTLNLESPGTLIWSWADFSFAGITLADGSVLFEICFDIVGNFNESTDITFSGDPIPIEVGDPDQNNYGFNGNSGAVNVSNSVLFVGLEQDSVSCPSFSDGGFTVTVSGGTAPYLMTWREIPPVGPFNGPEVLANDGDSFDVTGLPIGFYEVVVEDMSNPVNTVIDTIEVLSGPVLGVNLDANSPQCFGESTGSVSAEVILGGVILPNPGPEFTFTWNTTPDDVQSLTNVPSGFYAVTVTDGNGCEAMASTTLSQPAGITILDSNTFIQDASCSGAMDGEITITATGGTTSDGTYTYSWNNGLGMSTATNSVVNNLNPGEYCVTVTDDNGCEYEDCFSVAAVKTLSVNEVITNISCNGLTDGQIVVTGSTTGAPADLPYTFTWSNFNTPPVNTQTTSTISDLSAGVYTLTMTDSDPAGCEIVVTFDVTEPAALTIDLLEQVNETCVVGNDGSATIGVTGGTLPYSFSWNDPDMQTDSIASDLSAGTYTVEVTDANDCTEDLSVTILAPTPPTIDPIENDTVACTSDTDGSLTVTATPGGAAIASYMWSNNGIGQTITNLSPGTYFVAVTAEDGCVSIDSALVVAPEPLMIDSLVAESPDCPGDPNGQISAFVSGGTMPYTFTWSTDPGNPTTLNPLPGLTAGQYTVTVTDANNCPPETGLITVEDPPSIVSSYSDLVGVSCPDDATCDGEATVDIMYSDGSTGSFNVTWENSSENEMDLGVTQSIANSLCRGLNEVTINDGVCGITDTIEIESPEDIIIQVETTPVSCNGLMDGSITLTPMGGTAPYDILWITTGDDTPTITDLTAGLYTANITDANGCPRSQSVDLNEPDPLMLSLDLNVTTPSVTCNGDTDGVIGVIYNSGQDINPVGPNPFTWSGNAAPSSSDIANNLEAGTYSVTITDTKGCMDSLNYTIAEPTPIVAVIEEPVPPRCFGEATQIIIDTIFGGNGSDIMDYTYMIDNNGLNFPPDQPATVFAGPHLVTVMDIEGCAYTEELTITQPNQILVNFNPSEIVLELGDSLTQLNPIITSSLPIDSFIWEPSEFLSDGTVQNPFLVEWLSQNYSLTVVDVNGCEGSGSIFVELDANRNIFIPNVFSPNGDGPNDEFRIFACTGVESIESVLIFDRWGELIFEETTGLSPDCFGGTPLWDGKFNGRNVNPGVFVYLIEVTFLDGVTLLYRGDVTVLR